jgi:hypothetical protein
MEERLSFKGRIAGYAGQCACEPLGIIYGDGDRKICGPETNDAVTNPAFALHFKNKKAARQSISRGSLGFGKTYMDGEIEVNDDLWQTIRLSLHPVFDSYQAPIVSKLLDSFVIIIPSVELTRQLPTIMTAMTAAMISTRNGSMTA